MGNRVQNSVADSCWPSGFVWRRLLRRRNGVHSISYNRHLQSKADAEQDISNLNQYLRARPHLVVAMPWGGRPVVVSVKLDDVKRRENFDCSITCATKAVNAAQVHKQLGGEEAEQAKMIYYPNHLDEFGHCHSCLRVICSGRDCDGTVESGCCCFPQNAVYGNSRCRKNSFRFQIDMAKERGGIFLQVIEPDGLGNSQKDEVRWAKLAGIEIWHCFGDTSAAGSGIWPGWPGRSRCCECISDCYPQPALTKAMAKNSVHTHIQPRCPSRPVTVLEDPGGNIVEIDSELLAQAFWGTGPPL